MTSTPPVAPQSPRRPKRSLTSRTSLLTAAAVAGVLLAGTAAVAANIGILNAAESSAIGDLAATDDLLPAAGSDADTQTIVTVETAPSTTLASEPAASAAQQYDIAGTGTVWVMTTTSGLALDHVVAEPGWISTLTQADLRSLRVDFVNGNRTIVFTASIGDDGLVVVDVTEPTTVVAATPAASSASSTATPTTAPSAGGTYDDDDHDDDDHYEDDDHEYEGADDDD